MNSATDFELPSGLLPFPIVSSQPNLIAVNAIPIADETTGRLSVRERLNDLLCSPDIRRMLGHIETQHLATTMLREDNTFIVNVGTVKKSVDTI